MKKQAIKVNELSPQERAKGFQEVILGYSEDEALSEASRCLQCKNPACISGCPVGIDIKKFIYQLSKKDYASAYWTIKEANNFPSICGRVCPAEYQCRKACVLNKKTSPFASAESINIHFLERFIGDYGIKNKLNTAMNQGDSRGIRDSHLDSKIEDCKVAVVGSGPAGLCCAGELARKGIKVVVFESLHLAGGVLRYGIPDFRLPREILDFEIDYLLGLGVEFRLNTVVGKIFSLEDLFKQGFSSIFLGLGAGVPEFLGIKGENLCNIYSANEFLTRINLMSAHKFPEYHTPVNIGEHILIVGGGNTAIDAARCALRLQNTRGLKPDVRIIYRRTELELPARRLEIEHAQEEGIKFEFLVQPKEFVADAGGGVKKMICLKCQLGEPDSSGRKRPLAIKGSDFEIDCDLCVIATGLKANQVLTRVTPELKTDEHADIIVNPSTMKTSVKGVFAGGDIVGGEGTVIEAMGMAKRAAKAIANSVFKQ